MLKEGKKLFVSCCIFTGWTSNEHIGALRLFDIFHGILEDSLHLELLIFEISKAIWVVQVGVPELKLLILDVLYEII